MNLASPDVATLRGTAFSVSKPECRVLVCQLGAREHYLAARCLAKLGLLSCMATDFWSPVGQTISRMPRWLPKVVLSALARYHPELKGQRVASFPFLSAARYGLSLFDKTGNHETTIAKLFARSIGSLNIQHNVFFGYSYDSLEMLREERRNGSLAILCQTDPGPAHFRMVIEEETKWPLYATPRSSCWTQKRDGRLRQEWDLADVIIANSVWTRDSIIPEGAPASKIEILPLAYGPGTGMIPRREQGENGHLKVLWLGNVALGKGIQYLVEAARLLVDKPVEFLVAGNIFIASAIMKNGPKNIRWLGRIPRSATCALYNDCDVFVFPTLSDGFGITQLEALAHGLPVITTPNCGHVVDEGKTGFIIPPRDPRTLANAILRFVGNPGLARQMAPTCRAAAQAFSVEAYGKRLVEIVEKHLERRPR